MLQNWDQQSQTLYSSPSYFFPEGKAWCRHWWIFPSWEPEGTTCFIKPREINVSYQVYTSELSASYAQSSWMQGCFSGIYSGSIRYGGKHSHGDPQRASLFGEYTQMQLLPFLESQLTECCTRVDAVWDTHHIFSLKSRTRINRGETAGRRTKVSPKSLSQRDQNGNGFWMTMPTRMPFSNFSVTNFIETPQRQDVFWPPRQSQF